MKAALGEPLDFVMRKSNGTSFNILSEPLSTTPVVMYFTKNFYLKETFSHQIQNMLASGLIEYWIKNEKPSEVLTNLNDGEPKPMTLKDLSAPFMLCAGGLLVSAGIFMVEIIFYNYKKKTTFQKDIVSEFDASKTYYQA
jgi:hypothetical protein